MGSVFLATDRVGGDPVALKVLDLTSEEPRERFRREARVLSELSHPAIVRYVAHGETAQREPFLAMELLEGEDLAQRLAREGLSAIESVLLVRQTAEALAFAHGRGIVHRDVKPSNLYLVGGDTGRLKVLDFGIARASDLTHAQTRTGAMLGTVGYMAPEQAMGSPDVDPRADVFAIGCVLFECLTGRRAFVGDHPVAVLAKVLMEEPPRISELRPGLGEAVDALVARMLSRDRDARPKDAGEVLGLLDELGVLAGGVAQRDARPAEGLTGSERRIVSVIFAEPNDAETSRTVTPEHANEQLVQVRELAAKFGAEITPLAGGTLILVLSDVGPATDQASRGASCALSIREHQPDLRVVLATGWAETTGVAPVGPVIDRAAALLPPHGAGDAPGIRIDDVTAGLIGSRFEIQKHGDHTTLLGEQGPDAPRLLLGRPTPCVGREKDLALLEATLGECVDDCVARAVLVTAAPGTGKSRLRQEFVSRIRAKGTARMVLAQADSMSAGSAFVLARQIVQRTSGLSAADPREVQYEKLRARLVDRLGPKEARLVAEFLCEMLGVPVETDPSPILLAARGDPRLLADWFRSSFEDWLRVEAREPLLVVLEDLHWGDAPSVTYLGRVLSEGNLPLMVLALARPEVHEAFPKLWAGALHEVPLAALGRRAAEQLVHAVLRDPDPVTVTRIVERANGNAFYLEELIRAVAEGRGNSLSETVVAMAHARLERLEADDRRILRAASVLGERFWVSAVSAILGGARDVAPSLARLEDLEVVTRSRGDRFPSEREYVFRHALVRDAAYATLTPDDLTAAHRLAADWLVQVGETDPLVMADHLEKAGEPKRAVPWVIRAAEAAHDGGNAIAAVRLAERGKPHAVGADLGVLRAIEGVCAGALGNLEQALPALRDAVELLPRGGRNWFIAATGLAYFGAMAGNPAATNELADAIAELPTVATRGGLYAWSAARVVMAFVYTGQPERAKTLVEQLETAAALQTTPEASFTGWRALARIYADFWHKEGRLADLIRNARIAVTVFEETRDALAVVNARFWEANALLFVGRYREMESAVQRGLSRAKQSGNVFMARHLEMMLWYGLVNSGRAAEALAPLEELSQDPYPNVAVQCSLTLAIALLQTGDFARAEETARNALDRSRGMTPVEMAAHATLARVCLGCGKPERSLAAADRASSYPVSHPEIAQELGLTRAQALAMLGRLGEARSVIREARDRVLLIASTLDEDDRQSYLTNVDTNVRIVRLADEWLGAG